MSRNEMIGGTDKIVEIDESKFGKRKYHRGHRVEGQWVFGGMERGSGKVFMVPVEDRTKDTLLAIIKDYIKPGTTIYSDCWKSYDCLKDEGFVHCTVNSINFVDPESGAHTNGIESSWRHAKRFMPHYSRWVSHLSSLNDHDT
jgi:transposase-like protein